MPRQATDRLLLGSPDEAARSHAGSGVEREQDQRHPDEEQQPSGQSGDQPSRPSESCLLACGEQAEDQKVGDHSGQEDRPEDGAAEYSGERDRGCGTGPPRMTQGLRNVTRNRGRHRDASEDRGRQRCENDAGDQQRRELASMRRRENPQKQQRGAKQQT